MTADHEMTGAARLSRIFAEAGAVLYLVGGKVRNIALGLPGGDFDVCSAVLPKEAAKMLRESGLTVIEKALALGTIEVHLTHGGQKHIFEHTTLRRDFYPEGGAHRPYQVEFTDDVAVDARRRDFTINALYQNIEMSKVIDPTGRGLRDIQTQTIRAAAEDPAETLRDDGLRIMRMARFAAELGFGISDDLRACAAAHAHLLDDISAERKYQELQRILMADVKYGAEDVDGMPPHRRGLQILRDTGALQYVLPNLWEGSGVQQSEKYHAYDVLGHGIASCGFAPPVLILRLAALLHDIGKPRALQLSGKMTGHDELGQALAARELNALRADNRTKQMVSRLVGSHMFDLQGRAKPKTIRKRAVHLGRDMFEMLIALRRADFAGSGKPAGNNDSAVRWQTELDRMIRDNVPWSVGDLNISGSEISKMLGGASPKVGEVLNQLLWQCVSRPAVNTTDSLRKRAASLVKNT